MKTIQIDTLSSLEKAAAAFIQSTANQKVFAFYGEMGAGKTTFIKAICKAMGVTENITSPTFSLINEYQTGSGDLIYHFDCYRLKNISEAYDIGSEEYLYSGNYCFIEWPERIEELLPPNTINVKINIMANNCREVEVNV